MIRRQVLAWAAAAVTAGIAASATAQTITLHGASQFNDDHAFTKALVKFDELVQKYSGKKINFVLHKNSELGLEKDYFAYMNQGKAVDYAIVSPAHMSTFSRAAPGLLRARRAPRSRRHLMALIFAKISSAPISLA